MKGKELIEWIQKNHAENLEIIIQHRDSGGLYNSAERLGEFTEPTLCRFSEESWGIDTIEITPEEPPTGILL